MFYMEPITQFHLLPNVKPSLCIKGDIMLIFKFTILFWAVTRVG